MTTPQWRPIQEFPHYEVSSDGRVRSWRRQARKWRHPCSDVRETPVELSGAVSPLGYVAVMLTNSDGKRYRRVIHRLVAQAFLLNPLGLPDVAHNDGDPGNNDLSNLRWSTHRDNQMDMRRHGTMQDGEKCVTAKITTEIALEIRRRAKVRGEGRKLAKEFGLSFAQISRIKNGRRWAFLT